MVYDEWWVTLFLLLPVVGFCAIREFSTLEVSRQQPEAQQEIWPNGDKENSKSLLFTFLQVHVLVMGSEWLQV
jgi:hypothetical protein